MNDEILLIYIVAIAAIVVGAVIVLKGVLNMIQKQHEMWKSDRTRSVKFLDFATILAFSVSLLRVFTTNFSMPSLVFLVITGLALLSIRIYRLQQTVHTHLSEHQRIEEHPNSD